MSKYQKHCMMKIAGYVLLAAACTGLSAAYLLWDFDYGYRAFAVAVGTVAIISWCGQEVGAIVARLVRRRVVWQNRV